MAPSLRLPHLLSLVLLTTGMSMPAQAQSIDLGRLIFQGIQVLQVSTLSDAQEVALGQQINQNLTQSGDLIINRDPQLNNWITGMGQRLARLSDRPSLPYVFQVVEDPAINAFATMGGYVYITTGTIAAAQTEDQVAGVLAHEIAHITSRHGVKQLQQATTAQVGAQALGLDNSALAAIAFEVGVMRPRSREDEFEADVQGVWMLHRAGYDPYALPQMLTNLLGRPRSPELFSTHPAPQERIARLNQLISTHNLAPYGGGSPQQRLTTSPELIWR